MQHGMDLALALETYTVLTIGDGLVTVIPALMISISGGLIVGVTENLVGTYVSFIGTELKLTVALAIIIIVLVVKPSGLLGRSVVKRVCGALSLSKTFR